MPSTPNRKAEPTSPSPGPPETILKKLAAWKIELLILLFFALLFSILYQVMPAVRVGDGSDYYAMLLAWRVDQRPYLTDEGWQAYADFVQSGQVAELRSMTSLKFLHSRLQLGPGSDLSHFWFYSFLAFLLGAPFQLLGMQLGLYAAFLMLHALLLSIFWIIAYRCYAWKGLAAAAILTGLSPMIWFFNKVHTELFTFCVTTTAVIFFLRRRYLFSALCFSLAATQNISFAAMSGLVLAIGLVKEGRRSYKWGEALIFCITLALNLIHPFYYFFRFGVVDPQPLLGQASWFSQIPFAYIWFVDPDIGLFPHWPLGLLLLVAFGFGGYQAFQRSGRSVEILTFVGVYLGASLAAQTTTININSGGNPGVSRYALWYLALFFPLILFWLGRFSASVGQRVLLFLVLLPAALYNTFFYHPGIDQFAYVRPSPLSYWLQQNYPRLYNPPPEIFSERYGGLGENVIGGGYLAVLGPDCRKLLIMDPISAEVIGGANCAVDRQRLAQVIRQKTRLEAPAAAPFYIRLTQAEFDASRTWLPFSDWFAFNIGGPGVGWLQSGWSYPEGWGVWMAAKDASLNLLCPPVLAAQAKQPMMQFDLAGVPDVNRPKRDLQIMVNGRLAWEGMIEAERKVSFSMSAGDCQPDGVVQVRFIAGHLVSPTTIGINADVRHLGIGLRRFRYVAAK